LERSMTEFRIRVSKHKKSDLLMALIDEFPGFIVHAYSEDELIKKLGPEFETFLTAIGYKVSDVEVARRDSDLDFWPPAYIARASMDGAIA
jgi:hypothetical protein